MIYYTADLHFHYAPLLPGRPFASVEEMDAALIRGWNETVTEEDTVYVVGDVGYNGSSSGSSRLLSSASISSAATTTRALRTPGGCTTALRPSRTSARSTTATATLFYATIPLYTASGGT